MDGTPRAVSPVYFVQGQFVVFVSFEGSVEATDAGLVDSGTYSVRYASRDGRSWSAQPAPVGVVSLANDGSRSLVADGETDRDVELERPYRLAARCTGYRQSAQFSRRHHLRRGALDRERKRLGDKRRRR